MDGFDPVGHLLVELLQRPKLQIVLLLHILTYNRLLVVVCLVALFGVEDSLLLGQVADQRFPIGVSQEAQEVIDLVKDQQFDMRLHPNPINELLLFLEQRVGLELLLAPYLLYLGHLNPLLRLFNGLSCETEHLAQSLHGEVELRGWHRLHLLLFLVILLGFLLR